MDTALQPYAHSNLVLYFMLLKTIKNVVIPTRISVSFQITSRPAPLSIMALMIIINHLAGMILLRICNGTGILDMGNTNPDRMITGSIKPEKDIIMAVC